MWVPKPPSAPCVLTCAPAPIGPPWRWGFLGELLQRQRLELAGVGADRMGCAVFPLHGLGIDLPDFRRALAQRLDHLLGRLRHHHGGRKQHAAAAGEVGEADRLRVADDHRHAAIVDAEQFGTDVGDRGARAADVRMAGGHHHVAVLGDVHLRARFTAGVEPEAGRDAPALQLAFQRRLVVLGVQRRFHGLDVADARIDRTVRRLGPLLGGVLQPQLPADPSSAASASSSSTHSTA